VQYGVAAVATPKKFQKKKIHMKVVYKNKMLEEVDD